MDVDVSIGAVGAAVIAALVSLLGLIIGKEQKISEFRQAWIDKLRDELGEYAGAINTISDKLSVSYVTQAEKVTALSPHYITLNKAHYGIIYRLNQAEPEAAQIIAAMEDFETLAQNDANFIPNNIVPIEERFNDASRLLLKKEWNTVKRGEPTFRWAKWGTLAILIGMLGLILYLIFGPGSEATEEDKHTMQQASCPVTINNDGRASIVYSDDKGNATTTPRPPLSKPVPRRTVTHTASRVQATSCPTPPVGNQVDGITPAQK